MPFEILRGKQPYSRPTVGLHFLGQRVSQHVSGGLSFSSVKPVGYTTIGMIILRVQWLILGRAPRNFGLAARTNAFEVMFRVMMMVLYSSR